MRLTLRTMLAYLDGILEPADRDEIARKIEESDFARQLVQRLRECARNPHLAAPKVSGKTTGLDPNLVAEYLDNTLAGERVPEFEKVCLESDVFLAEVAACHQILTMVLAQPADIDLELKQQMYGVLNQAQRASASEMPEALAERQPGLPDDIWVKPQRRKLEVPDYLREGPKRFKWKPLAAGILLVLILVLAVAMALGPLDRTHPIARLLGFGPAPENRANTPETNQHGDDSNAHTATANQTAATTGETAKSESTENGGGANPSDSSVTAAQLMTKGASATEKSGNEKSIETPPTVASNTAQTSNSGGSSIPPVAPMPDAPAPSPVATNLPPPEPGAPKADSNTTPPPIPQPTVGNSANPPTVADKSHNAAPNDMSKGSTPSPETPPAPGDNAAQPVDNTPVGRLLPGKDVVLLKFDNANNQWTRVASGAAVTAGEQLLALPTYRPTITLSAGITLEIPEETLLQLGAPSVQGVPIVKLIYGRLAAITTGKAGALLGLDLGGIKGVVNFVDGDATLGVEVRHYYPLGANPESEAPHVAADLFAAHGRLEWTAADGTVTALTAPQRWIVAANPAEGNPPATVTAANMPKWIDPEPLRPTDAQASEYLAQSLQDDKPLLVALGEMVDHRRLEIKSLGAQCLAMLDEFEPLVSTFSDPDQRPMWSVEIASVKAALARGSVTAAKVHEAFVKQRGDELGTDLYRMFLGYNKEQLQNGEAAKTVDFLDHDNLDCRVLAFANLQEITNKTFNYRPEAPAATRAQPLRRWQEELKNGAIVPHDAAQK